MEAWFHRVAKSSNLHIAKDFLSVTFDHPGINYSMLDRDDQPSVTSLLFFCYTARSVAIRGRNECGQYILDWDWTRDQRFEFVVSSEMTVAKEMYSEAFLMHPLVCTFSVVDVGTTSMVTQTTFYKVRGSNPILTNVLRTVSVDAMTRRPKPYPPRVIQMVKQSVSGKDLNSKHLDRLERPANTFVHGVEVAWSDTDGYNHCNFASYSRYVVDAIHSALRTGRTRSPVTRRSSSDTAAAKHGPEVQTPAVKTSMSHYVNNSYSSSNKTNQGEIDDGARCNDEHLEVSRNTRKQKDRDNHPISSNKANRVYSVQEASSHKGDNSTKHQFMSNKGGNSCDVSCYDQNQTRQIGERNNNNLFSFNMSNDVIKCGLKSCKIRYFKECLEGQRLDVHIWQDGLQDNVVFSSLERGDDVICQITLDFFNAVSKL